MLNPEMPLIMRIMGHFGTTPELVSTNVVRVLITADAAGLKGVIVRKSKEYKPEKLQLNSADAEKLRGLATAVGSSHGLLLP